MDFNITQTSIIGVDFMPWVLEPEYSKKKIEEYLSYLTEKERNKFKFRLLVYLEADGKIEDLFS